MSEKKYSKQAIVALCSLVYFVSYFSRKDFAAVMAAMLSEGAVDKNIAGLIGTMLFVFYGVGQLLSGYLGDKIKPKILLIVGLSATALFNLLMPLVPTPALMIPVWAGNGLAQAMLWPPIVKILANNLDNKSYVKANFIVTSAAHIATILLYLYVPVCLEFWDWETVFFTATALAIVAMVIFAVSIELVLPKAPTAEPVAREKVVKAEKKKEEPIFKALADSGLFFIFGCIVMCGILRDGIESWLPTLYSEAFARDSSESILVSVILPIFSIISISVILALHKRKLFNNEIRGTAILFMISAAICVPLAILIGNESTVARVICLVLAALVCAVMHGVNFLLISCVPGRFVKLGRSSTVSGLTNAFVYIGAASSMYGFALLSENIGWSGTVVCWIAVALLGVAFAIPAKRPYTNFIK